MPNSCKICRHRNVSEINAALIESRPFRSIAAQWSVSKSSLIRHGKDHLPAHLSKAAETLEFASASDLIERIKALETETKAILAEERTSRKEVPCPNCSATVQVKSGSSDVALRAIARLEAQVRLAGEVLGELTAKLAITVTVKTPEDLWKVFEQGWAQLTPEHREREITRLLQEAEREGWRQPVQ